MTDEMLHDRLVEIEAMPDSAARRDALREWDRDALNAQAAEDAAESIQAVLEAIGDEIEDGGDDLEIEMLRVLHGLTHDALVLDARCRLTGERADDQPAIAAYDALFAELRTMQRVIRQRPLTNAETVHYRGLIEGTRDVADWAKVPF